MCSKQTTQVNEDIVEEVMRGPTFGAGETHQFKAETKKLLDIVAKSIYTDKEVFLRELMSNCSDALEKQRFAEISGQAKMSEEPFYISVTTNEKARTVTIFDSGIGMTRDEVIDNLGTIARSGSQAFVKEAGEEADADSIIGQFGVGFYSSFIVADSVEVISKSDKTPAVRWISDGSGDFEVAEAENINFERGTQIKLHLRPDCREFCRPREVETIVKKFSMFINHPIKLNGEVINALQALWYRDRKEVSEDEYEQFYESIAKTKVPYKFKMHYSTDVPLAIKALLYYPSTNPEKFNMQPETSQVHLYSRKVLIKQNCTELLPSYLRFVKGIVDCEDLPLNISRENYQDSHLISKLRSVLTRRVIKQLEDELKMDPERYDNWYKEFQNHLKEGMHTDNENAGNLMRLLRFKTTFSGNYCSLDDYVKRMKPDQKKIYFLVAQEERTARNSPFLEPFKGKNAPPVIFLENHIDEMCFRQVDEYKGHRFVNIETNFEEIAKDVDARVEVHAEGLPEKDTTSFCLWIKAELEPYVSKVSISKRLKTAPAVIVGDVSASMRMMMKMVDESQFMEASKNQVLEVNPNHPIVVKLNALRKTNPRVAGMMAKQVLDTVYLTTGLPIDVHESADRAFKIFAEYLENKVQETGVDEAITIEEDEPILAEAERTKKPSASRVKVDEFKV